MIKSSKAEKQIVREFRALRYDNNEWVKGSLIEEYGGDYSISYWEYNEDKTDFVQKKVSIYTDTVGQHTGLNDKNGKEIYEGDILIYDGNGTSGVVRFNRSSYEFQYGNGKYQYLCFRHYKSENFEVIGNIYQNPELIAKAIKK